MGWEWGDRILRRILVGTNFAQMEGLVAQKDYSTKSSHFWGETIHKHYTVTDGCQKTGSWRPEDLEVRVLHCIHRPWQVVLHLINANVPCVWKQSCRLLSWANPGMLEVLAGRLPWRYDASIKLTRQFSILGHPGLKQLPFHLQENSPKKQKMSWLFPDKKQVDAKRIITGSPWS
jgi:hypothetical protein